MEFLVLFFYDLSMKKMLVLLCYIKLHEVLLNRCESFDNIFYGLFLLFIFDLFYGLLPPMNEYEKSRTKPSNSLASHYID